MPKFKILSSEINDKLLTVVRKRVEEYLEDIFEPHELVKQDNIFSFSFGTVQISVSVKPWHFDDAIVHVYSYIADYVHLSSELSEELLRLNATVPFGSFGITFDKSIIYSYSLPGVHLDFEEFLAAVQTVATVADSYDERIMELKG
jgi:hypothetical protein